VFEVFQVTGWGSIPTLEQLLQDVPGINPEASPLEALRRRLDQWRAAAGQ
jgi:hypothetical protein